MTTLSSLNQYGNSFQTKVIASLLTNDKFLKTVNDVITPDYFDSQSHKWIIEEILKYYKEYHTTPTMETLQVEMKKLEHDILKIAIKEQLRESYKAPTEDKEYVEDEFSKFCKNQSLKSALLTSVDLLNAGSFDDIRSLINSALQAGTEKNLGHEYLKDIETRYRIETRNPISTPWSHINELTQGGLGSGDLGLIFGNPGGGKSWLLIAIGAHAATLGYNVLHYTLELSEAYVGLRYDAFFSGIDFDKVIKNREQVEQSLHKVKGNIVIKEFPMYKASMTTLESHYSKCVDEGLEPDIILIDYVDLLGSPRSRNDRKQEIDDNYAAAKGWAREINKPIWTPSQVNRAGAKDEVIEGDKAAGSYDKMMIADFALSLSRMKKDKVTNGGRIHVMKNRFGSDGMTYKVNMNTATGHTELISSYEDAEDMEFSDASTPKPTLDPQNQFNKKDLRSKFFELNISE
jgi:replicative DNA helicase